jgi:hemolysin activation/secretion protein
MHRCVVLRLTLCALAVAVAFPCVALAQQAPNSGQLLQQLQPPPAPPAPPPKADLTIQPPATSEVRDNTPFAVTSIRIDGNTAFPVATLHALVASGEGRTLTLAQLYELARRITDYYHAHGYPLARAIVPPQTLDRGEVRLSVLEGRIERSTLDNRSRIDDSLLRATLAPLDGQLIRQSSLDQRLLLLDDLPGASAHATLSPGAQNGTSDLDVRVDPAPWLAGNLTLDDEGDRYTGRVRLGANVLVNDPLRLGDQLSASALTSGHDMRYGRLGYEMALNGYGTRLGAAYSVLDYHLGESLADLRARGTAHEGSVWVNQALIRHRDGALSARLEVDEKRLDDDVDSTGLHDDRHVLDWTASLNGNQRDGWGGGGIDSASIGVTRGHLGFDDAVAASADAFTARTQGFFTRWNASVSRLQTLTPSTRLFVSLSGQYSGSNLDSSEQFLLGGPDTVRGYEVSTLAGASGFLATLELRHDLALPWAGAWQASVFVDHGGLWVDARTWPGSTGPNHAGLDSAGVGLNWAGPAQWTASVQLAAPVGGTPELAGQRPSTRAWVQLSKGF